MTSPVLCLSLSICQMGALDKLMAKGCWNVLHFLLLAGKTLARLDLLLMSMVSVLFRHARERC